MAPELSTRPTSEAAIDVGIPTRGEPRYLVEAIESVLAQSRRDWRLTISDNGPGSAFVERLVRPYLDDPRISYSPTGEAVSPARNFTRLVRAGGAPYVAILHDDDRWQPTFLERRVAFLERNPECGFVFSHVVIIDADGRPLGTDRAPIDEGVHTTPEILPRLFRTKVIIGVPTVLVRRSAYDAVGAYSDDVAVVDYEMWLRLAARFAVGFVDAADAEYRIHPDQASSRQRLTLASKRLEVVEKAGPALPLPPRVRRRALADALARCALDAAELGQRADALAALRRAVRADPSALVRPTTSWRLAAGAIVAVAGGPSRRVLGRVRAQRFAAGGARPADR